MLTVTRGSSSKKKEKLSLEDLAQELKNGNRGMIVFKGFGLTGCGYVIEGTKYSASGLSIGNETIPTERAGKIVAKTYFRRAMLGKNGNPDELVKVEVEIDPAEIELLNLRR